MNQNSPDNSNAMPLANAGGADLQPQMESAPGGSATFILMLSFLATLTPFSLDMYLPSLPAIGRELGVGIDQVQYTVSAFLLGLACGPLIHGPLSDTVGRIRVLKGALAFYLITTALCSIAQSLWWLIVLRFIQAFCCGALPVLIPAMVNDSYRGRNTAKALSTMMMVMTVAPLVAPIIGGYLVVHGGWRWLFYVLFLLGLMAMAVAVFYLKESHSSLKESHGGPNKSHGNIRKAQSGYINEALRGYWQVIGNPQALTCIICVAFAFAGLFTYVTGAAFVYIEYHGVATENFGYFFGFNVLFLLLGNFCNRRLLTAFSPQQLLFWACQALALVGIALVIVTINDWGGIWSLCAVASIFLGCMGFIAPNASALTLNQFPSLAGTASSVLTMSRFAFGAAGGYGLSLIHNNTPVPLASIMCLVAIGALITSYALRRSGDVVET